MNPPHFKGLRIHQIVPILARICDLLAMTAIFGSGEVSWYMLLPVVFFGSFAFAVGLKDHVHEQKIINRLLFLTLVALVIAGLVVLAKTKLYPLLIATYTTLIVHSLMWFLPAINRTRSVRLLIGLVEVAVAAVLTPDLYIGVIIFCFVVLGSVEVSLMFLEDQLHEYAPERLKEAVPQRFMFHSFTVSIVVFLLSLLIFPVLPRVRTNLGGSWTTDQKTRTGYNEQVNLGALPNWVGSQSGQGLTALRVFLPPELDTYLWQMRIPKGLLRGRVLDRFDGNKWTPFVQPGKGVVGIAPHQVEAAPAQSFPMQLEIIREPLEVATAPMPYGTHSVVMGSGSVDKTIYRTPADSWFVSMSEKRRIQYFPITTYGHRVLDEPHESNLAVPKEWILDSEKWQKLFKEIFAGTKTALEKIEAIDRYYKKNKFIASTEPLTREELAAHQLVGSEQDPKKQLDVFMFYTHKGHCEYFSSAAAFLLRMAGVPTRLISGFRVSTPPAGGVLTVRQGDGHAWIEAWVEGRGWIAVDPTPFSKRTVSRWSEMLSRGQDYMSAYWYRYVLSFDQADRSEKSKDSGTSTWKDAQGSNSQNAWIGQQATGWLIPIAIVVGVMFFFGILRFGFLLNWKSFFFWSSHSTPWSLRVRGWKAENHARRKLGKPWSVYVLSEEAPVAARRWTEIHERLKFGPVEKGSSVWRKQLNELDQIWSEIDRL